MAERRPGSAIVTIEEALEEIRAGRMIILMDDEDRENEGDLCVAADRVTAEHINFMATHGRGLICLSLTESRCEQLGLPMPEMPQEAQDRLRAIIPFSSPRNPVDCTAQVTNIPTAMGDFAEAKRVRASCASRFICCERPTRVSRSYRMLA